MVITDILSNIIDFSWPTIILASVIIICLRLTYLVQNKQKFHFVKELVMFAFIIYVLALFQVVTFQDVSYGSANYIPFKEISRYTIGSRLFIKNVIGNLAMFIPFGFFTAYFLKSKKIYPVLIISSIVSITIEIIQLIIGRVFDIDDIILNIVGAILGYLIYKLFIKIQDKMPKLLKKYYISNIIIVALVILLIIYVVSFFRIG